MNFPSVRSAISKCQMLLYRAVAEPITKLQIIWQFRNRLKRFSKRRWYYIQQRWRKFNKPRFEDKANLEQANQPLQSGDRVRIKSKQEILALLDPWLEQKGCGFMEEMWVYCDTEQVVRNRVEKFMDEATLRMRTSKGIVLLEGLMCEGTIDFGRCDRSCFYFWREEWLEKIE